MKDFSIGPFLHPLVTINLPFSLYQKAQGQYKPRRYSTVPYIQLALCFLFVTLNRNLSVFSVNVEHKSQLFEGVNHFLCILACEEVLEFYFWEFKV